MRCPDCGAEAWADARFCPMCGHSFTGAPLPSDVITQRRKKDNKNAMIAAAVVVAVVVVGAISSYVFFLTISPDIPPDGMTPAASYSKTTITDGARILIVSISRNEVPWDNVVVQLTDSSNSVTWSPKTWQLDGGSLANAQYAPQSLGPLSVYLTVTDITGNGFVSGGDFFTLTTTEGFSSSVTYQACLLYLPTGEKIGTGVTFVGL